MKTLTVFTPTFNRAYTLHKCYESLRRQTSKDFVWLIIDDGSSDNTKELVESWINEKEVDIRYHYQNNKGMHGAHNTAYELIDTQINTCIDSDDYMTDDAVEKIVEFWKSNRNRGLAGFVALDAYENGEIIGTKLPSDISETTYFDIYNTLSVKGDKKFIYRSDLTKLYPYPIFEGEKYVSLAYKYAKLDDDYKLGIMNEVVCIVEYMEDGSSLNMFKQYRRNPRGFAFIRIENMKNPRISSKNKFKECIHYVSSGILSKDKQFLKKTPNKVMTVLAIPFGIALYLYILKKTPDLN
ncbi:glycosyltransferase family A protein [Clostridium saudiense]|uniref:glycosyltransferase family A protein n=1 Tax=Clostridium saudiense TaxID=1414720 RepID=UPI0018AA2052|nr:glycosyltransferase family A protein [Clostridium saudiense]MEE0727549.1 glycosyltransferase family A protein [Clostridium saudiense]